MWEAQAFCTPRGSFAQGYGEIDGNDVVFHASKASDFNLMVVAVRKDPAAIEEMAFGEEYEEIAEPEEVEGVDDPDMVLSEIDEEAEETAEL